jgi:hypothetical protein
LLEPSSGTLTTGWKVISKLWGWYTEPKAKLKELESRLDEKQEFDRKLSELETRQEDDNLYRRKDGTGPFYCSLCIEHDHKFIAVFNHFADSYYCHIHNRVFELEARRMRARQQQSSLPIERRPGGPHGWMSS